MPCIRSMGRHFVGAGCLQTTSKTANDESDRRNVQHLNSNMNRSGQGNASTEAMAKMEKFDKSSAQASSTVIGKGGVQACISSVTWHINREDSRLIQLQL